MVKVTLEFVGMCLFVEKPSAGVSVGLLDEPGHLHLIMYSSPEDAFTIVESLGLQEKEILLKGCTPGEATIEPDERLPELGELPGTNGPIAEAKLEDILRCRIVLGGGKIKSLPAIGIRDPRSESFGRPLGTWAFRDEQRTQEFDLTDRAEYTSESADGSVHLGSIELGKRNGEIRATIVAIDQDSGRPRPKLRPGEPLTEFALFYQCTELPGPIPTYVPPGRKMADRTSADQVRADPGNPICPMARLRLAK